MAHKWNPKTDPIGKNEPIGRRLFGEPMLMGAQDQPSFKGLDYRHFEVSPADRELSLDRLGCTGVERKAKNYLKPLAVAAGANRVPPKPFNGWVQVRASVLGKGLGGQSFPVIASPIDLDEIEGIEENTHHAHIVIEDDVTFAAFRLREIFTSRGSTVETIEPLEAQPTRPEPSRGDDPLAAALAEARGGGSSQAEIVARQEGESASVWRLAVNLLDSLWSKLLKAKNRR